MKRGVKLRARQLAASNYQQILIVFAAFLTMVLVSYFYVSRIVQKEIRATGEEAMEATQLALSNGLHEAELFLASVAHDLSEMLEDDRSDKEISEYMGSMYDYYGAKRMVPDAMNLYAYIRGEFFCGSGWIPPEHYAPMQRPWFTGAVENGKDLYVSSPYVDADTNEPCISFSRQLFDSGGDSYGVVAVHLKLGRIINYVANRSNNGYGVLLDEELRFIAHREDSLTDVKLVSVGGEYEKLVQMLLGSYHVSAERFTDVDGTDSVAFFRTIFNGWHIGVIIPRASYYQQVNELGAVLGGLGFILMLVLSYMLVRIRSAQMRSDEESRCKTSFLAKMSHEMRTPMNAIIGSVGLARKAKDADDAWKHLDNIDNSAAHLLGMINNVLDMSRIEAGKMELSNTEFPFRELLNQASAAINPQISEKDQKFEVQVDENVPKSIVADRQKLFKVIINLLSNANRYTQEGGNIGLFAKKTEEFGNRCRLLIEVSDDGIGIPEEFQERLFNAFEQADNSISRKYDGAGLGLAISKKIVEMMNGKIGLKSKPGEGSRFFFTVDVTFKDLEELKAPAVDGEENARLFGGKHILLVDDVELNREILIASLEDTGITFSCAENGVEACELFALNPGVFDMIFMDIHMPGMDGYEATRRIRAMKTTEAQTIPIVAMTADTLSEDVEKCLAVGMNDHIGKPLRMDIVEAIMKRYLLYFADFERRYSWR